jgi:hypothetical protein
MQIKVRLDSRLTQRWAKHFSKQTLLRAARVMGPTLVALTFAGVARAQGTISFSGAQTFMQTVQTFAIYAGAVICFGGLIFAGIRMMSGRFQDAIPGLFGAGVLGWGAGWIGAPARSAGTGACRLLQRRLEHGREEVETHSASCPQLAILD